MPYLFRYHSRSIPVVLRESTRKATSRAIPVTFRLTNAIILREVYSPRFPSFSPPNHDGALQSQFRKQQIDSWLVPVFGAPVLFR